MKTRLVGVLALITLILVLLWALTIVWGVLRSDLVETQAEALDYVQNRDGLYLLTYGNAVLFTLSATMLFGALYAYYQSLAPAWSAVGFILVPVYSTFNLFVYASQITIVPQLAQLQTAPESEATVTVFLAQMVQAWPGSAVGILNGLAYAVLGIPSIIFGLLLIRGNATMRAAGALLVLNAIACIAGPLGSITGIALLQVGTVVGGFLFLLALVPLSAAFLRMDPG